MQNSSLDLAVGVPRPESQRFFIHIETQKFQNVDFWQVFEFMLRPSRRIWVPMGPTGPKEAQGGPKGAQGAPIGSHWPSSLIYLMTTSMGHTTW